MSARDMGRVETLDEGMVWNDTKQCWIFVSKVLGP